MKWTSTRRRQVVKPQRKWCWTNTSPRSWQLLSHWGCRGWQGTGDPCGSWKVFSGTWVVQPPSFALDWLWLKHLELIWIWIMLESDKLLWLLPFANFNSYPRGRGLLSFPARCSCLSGDILFRDAPQKTIHQHNNMYWGGTKSFTFQKNWSQDLFLVEATGWGCGHILVHSWVYKEDPTWLNWILCW